jgi:tRNA threonylcarbamoyladenosine biosynthesis protein TsaB
MNLLAIDTATDRFSVAIGDSHPVTFSPAKTFNCNQKGDSHLFDTWLLEADVGLRHSELSMDCIDTLMRQAALKPEDLNGIVCMGGPGSFTGLRIGFSLAKGLALSLGIPFAAVPTLDCMAWPFSALPGIVVPVIDAKKGAYFCALYQNGKKLTEDMDATPREIAAELVAALTANHCPRRAQPGVSHPFEQSSSPLPTPHSLLPTLLTGPGAPLLYEQLCAMNLQGGITWGKNLRWGNAATLLHIARETGMSTQATNTAAGPEYIRKSDAELGNP